MLDFIPRARRRDGSAGARPDGVRSGERRAVGVAAGVDENPPSAIDLVEFLREVLRIALHHEGADRIRESRGVALLHLAVDEGDNVEAFRSGRFDDAVEAELPEEGAERERDLPQDVRLIVGGRIEIEDADIGAVEIRDARRPDVVRDRVLVRGPQERWQIVDERMAHGAVLLRHVDARQPLRESLDDALLPEAFLADAGWVALHRDRTSRD